MANGWTIPPEEFYVRGSLTGPKNLEGGDFDYDRLINGPLYYYPPGLLRLQRENTFVINNIHLRYFLFCLVFCAKNYISDVPQEDDSIYILYKPDRRCESAYNGLLYSSIVDGSYYNFSQDELESNYDLARALQFRTAILNHFPVLPNFIYINRY